jgi:RNA ligase
MGRISRLARENAEVQKPMKITNIHQLLPVIEGRPEFVVIDKGDYTVIDYVYQDQDTFNEPLLMECRGIKFDKNGLIIARPFRKFFNYGEQGSGLPIHRPHYVTHKLDGSMIHPVRLDRRTFLMTRKGHTDVAQKAERYVLSAPSEINYHACFQAFMIKGYTPIFEYIGPDNRIVLPYNESSLQLLAARHIVNGSVMDRPTMIGIASLFLVPVVPLLYEGQISDVDGFVRKTRELKDAEGYVIYFDDGYMVKIKAEDYVLKHRALDDMSSKKKVVALCCQGFMDDVLPILNEQDAAELIEFNRQLQDEINSFTRVAHGLIELCKDEPDGRKRFALNVVPSINPKWLAGVCFGIMDGKNARQLVLKAVEKGGYTDIDVKWRGQ